MFRRIRLVALTIVVALLSCQETVTLPPVQGPPLQVPEAQRRLETAARPLEVIYVSPSGQLTSPHAQITVSFNKPMVSLEKVEDRAAQSPLVIEPAIRGKQRWLGSRTLTFSPDKELPGATSYALKVPKGLRSLDGSTLDKEKAWTFTTPLLAVARALPYRGSRWESPDTKVQLWFNQPVDAQTLEKHAAFTIYRGGTKPMAIAAQVQQGKDAMHMVVQPATGLPLDATVVLRVASEMTGREGRKAMGSVYSHEFRTYGPLKMVDLSCEKSCDPEGSIRLQFTNPVSTVEARKAIRVNGTPLKVGSNTWPSAVIYLDLPYKARSKYTVTVAPTLKDKFGQTLKGERSASFATGDLDPMVSMPLPSGVLEASAPRVLPIFFRNAVSANLLSKRLSLADVATILGHVDYWDREKSLLQDVDGVQRQQLKVTGRPNTRVTKRVNLTALGGGKPRGILALELETTLQPRPRGDSKEKNVSVDRALVRITDLAVTAKYSPHTSLIWVTSLSSGKPVSGAAVSIWREKGSSAIWSGTTDASGLAVAPGASQLGSREEPRKFIFFAEKDNDQSFVVASTSSGISPWDFGYDATWDDESTGTLGMLFTDRGIYRPGETVHVKGIVRRTDAKGLVTPRGTTVKLSVSDSRGEKLQSLERRLSEFGSFDFEVKLPVGAGLGSYGITGKPEGGGSLYGSFRVEEFRPAEFKVAVQSERREHVRGDTMAWTARGDYLFGAPMRGAAQRWSVYRSTASFAPPKHEGFVFSDEVWWSDDERQEESGFVARGEGKLDGRGQAAGTVPLKPPKMSGPQSYELELTVTDVSRQTISSRTSVLLHPGEIYLGAKPKETFLTAGQALETEIVAVTPQGKRVGGVAIDAELYLRTWTSVRKEGMGGAHYFISRPVETAAGGCKIVSVDKPKVCKLTIAKAGYYVLRLKGKDKRGNPLMTSFGAYVSGPDYVAWRRDNESKVELVTDRKSYKVGQVARIMIKSPFANAHGLFTVERNGIYTRKPFKLERTSAWMEVPITESLIPNAYVSVHLVRGRTAPFKAQQKNKKNVDEDPGRPTFKVGYTKLTISQAKRQLSVDVKPERAEYRPGDEVAVELNVRDAAGKGLSAELTVFVADEGVLSLIGYKTPDPMAIFYAERGLSVRTADNRIQLISQHVFGEKGGNAGGGGGGMGAGGEGVRRNFVSTPYFNPAVLTDGKGRAQVRFKLPDNLTTFRIMAVATSKEADFGSAHGSVKVNKPMLLLPTLPRLVRVGDHFEAGVVIHNNSKSSGEVKVDAQVQGLQLAGPATQNVTVKERSSVEARFAFTALTPGQATFRFTATLADQQDKLELKRPVKLPLVMEAVASFGSTEGAVAEGFVPSSGVRNDVGGLQLALSSSALVGLKPAMEYLMEYPYECLEQTTSRMVPLVMLRELAAAYNLKGPKDEEIDPLVRALIGRIEQLQRWDGGFSYWPAGYDSFPWVSAYAAWGLARAKEGGYPVSARILNQARSYLKGRINSVESKDKAEAAMQRNLKAYLAYVLVVLGEKPAAQVSRLYERRADLATFGKALLLSAMVRLKSDRQMIDTLTQELVNQVHQTARVAKVEENLGDGYQPFFHSDDRSTALVVEALLGVKPDHPLVEKMIRYLLEVRKEGRWRNTQETVYALLAMHSYYKIREKEIPSFVAKVLIGDATLMRQQFEGRSLKVVEKLVPMKSLQGQRGAVGFVKEGTGRLYYSARLRYARSAMPKEPWDEGFYVTRTYEQVKEDMSSFNALRGEADSERKGTFKVKAGDLVRVTLRIVSPQQMHFVAVDDPLPAGLEAINFRLMTAAQSMGYGGQPYGFRPSYSRHSYTSPWYTPFYHQELRDDRVQLFADAVPPGVHTYVYLARATTIGKFVAAPTHVEQMYSPEVFGRTGGATFEVVEK
jgi:alpha-2-macroglobulin